MSSTFRVTGATLFPQGGDLHFVIVKDTNKKNEGKRG